MSDDTTSFHVHVLANRQWSHHSSAETIQQAKAKGEAALQDKIYLQAYRIVCERKDRKTGKANITNYPPVERVEAEPVIDEVQAERRRRAAARAKSPKTPPVADTVRFSKSLVLYMFVLLGIVWGGYSALEALRSSMFTTTPSQTSIAKPL